MRTSPQASSPAQRRRILITVGLALMMVVSAVSGLNVALPDLARDTGATQSEVQWIVDAYTMVFAGLLLVAGAEADHPLARRAARAVAVTPAELGRLAERLAR
jgi:MFS family permease